MYRFLLILTTALILVPKSALSLTYLPIPGGSEFLTCKILDENAKTCSIERGLTWSGRYSFPSKVSDGNNEYTVVAIESRAFYSSSIRAVKIPSTVVSIGDEAFRGCQNLTSAELPNTITSISAGLFFNCPELSSVNIPSGVTSIGALAFGRCSALKSIEFPQSVKEIGESVFENCSALASANIPQGISSIADRIFYGCNRLESIKIPQSVTHIGESAFYNCLKLTSLSIPSGVTAIGTNAFKGCFGLTAINIPQGVTSISNGTFSGCSGLKTLEIPAGVTSIGIDAFKDCSELTAINIPQGVTSISNGTFSGCSSLKILEIPAGVTSIGIDAFKGCSGLTAINIPQGVTSISNGTFSGCSSLTAIDISSNITAIGSGAFSGCSGLRHVTIPPSVTSLATDAFTDCTGIIKAAYPDRFPNPFSTGAAAPYNADDAIFADGWIYNGDNTAIYYAPLSVKGEYILPATIKQISPNAFFGCSGITSVKALPATPAVIADNSFAGLYDTVSLIVDRNTITDYLSCNWSLFKNVKTSESGSALTTYSDGVLNYRLIPATDASDRNTAIVIPGDYSELTGVTVPERFTYTEGTANTRYYVDGVGYGAFKNCDRLAAITFSSRNAATVFGDYAFAGTGISQIAIPKTVERIGSNAFRGCPSLSDVDIPGNVFAVGDSAFFGLPALKKITLHEGLETIGARAFSNPGTESIDAIYLPSTVTSVGADAFAGCQIDMVEISSLGPWLEIDFANPHANPLSQSGRLSVDGTETDRIIIPETTAEIKPYAFYGLNALRRLTVSGSVTSIGAGAFAADSGHQVSNIEFAYGPEPISIDTTAFTAPVRLKWDRSLNGFSLRTDSITELCIGNNVTRIPASIFSNIAPLSSLSLGTAIEEIGSGAFSGCTSLKEAVLPPNATTIGASAFAGNTGLTEIAMGHSVTSIGEKAFDRCPATVVNITAQTPPSASNNSFSNYSGRLNVQGEKTVDAYYDAFICWDRFEGFAMTEPTGLILNRTSVAGNQGDTIRLTATLRPDDVTLPHIFWRSTNPAIATVDNNGLVTIHAEADDAEVTAEADASSGNGCKIIAETLYAAGPVAEAEVFVTTSAIESITDDNSSAAGKIDYNAPLEVYNLLGVKVASSVDGLAKGIYIVRQGNATAKIAVK